LQIIHMSDLHIGAKPHNEPTIYNDIIEAFSNSVEIIKQEKPDLVVIAGDIFHTPKPDNDSLRFVMAKFKEIASFDIPIILAHGEHDTPGRRESTILQVISSALDKVYAPYYESKPSSSGEPVYGNIVKDTWMKVRGLNIFVYPFKKMSQEKRKSFSKQLLPYYNKFIKREGGKSIFVGHFSIDPIFVYDAIATEDDLPDANYIALGHVHKRHIIRGPKYFVYPGSLYPLDIREAEYKNKRGPILVDLSSDEPSIEEIGIPIRSNVIGDLEINDERQIDKKIKGFVEVKKVQAGHKKPIIYLRIRMGKNVYSRVVLQSIERVGKETDVVIIPILERVGIKEEGTYRISSSDRNSLDPVFVMVNSLKIKEEVAKLLIELRDASLNENDEKVDEILSTLSTIAYSDLKVWI